MLQSNIIENDRKGDVLAVQLATYIAPHHLEVQGIVIRLVRAISQGNTCLALTTEDQQILSSFTHPALSQMGAWLYLERYANYEKTLVYSLQRLMQSRQECFECKHLDQYFDDEYQRQAAVLALTNQLAIITGGPGTGKTTTVVKILGLLLLAHQQNNHVPLSIALAAPTGKAAMRLSESIANSLNMSVTMKGFESVMDKIPKQAQTLHRLLGARPLSVEFRHHADNPLLEDVIVVDEASMIDLALMAKLVQSLKPTAKLILLGDKDQLASVESGSVLADLYATLQTNRMQLQNTYRFSGKIKDLALAVNQQLPDQVMALLWEAMPEDPIAWQSQTDRLASDITAGYQVYFERVQSVHSDQDVVDCFTAFNAFQVLTPMRQGQFGVEGLNVLAEKRVVLQEQWYVGRAIMIMQNDSNTQLYNGDIGLCLPSHQHGGQLRVFFLQGASVRSFLPSRLPQHETAFAMTIHKSQGSEFGHVMIVLPASNADQMQGVLTKELLYTAITRGKEKVTLVADEFSLRLLVTTKVKRTSGLPDRFT